MLTHKRLSSRMRLLAAGTTLLFLIDIGSDARIYAGRGTSGTGQEADKVVEKWDDFNPPVKVTAVKSKLGEIELGRKMDAPDDWLRGLSIRVRNGSDKAVTGVTVELWFKRPPEQAARRDFVFTLQYGSDPFTQPQAATAYPPAPVLPGESIDIPLADVEYEHLRAALSELDFPRGGKAVRIRVRAIGFGDGTAWTAGAIFERDPNNPQEWIRKKKSLVRENRGR